MVWVKITKNHIYLTAIIQQKFVFEFSYTEVLSVLLDMLQRLKIEMKYSTGVNTQNKMGQFAALSRYMAHFLILSILILVTGCDNGTERSDISQPKSEESSPSSAGKTVLINWIGHWKGEKAREDLIGRVKKDFEFIYPDVQIHLTYNVDLPGENSNHKIRVADTVISMIETDEIDWDIIYLDISVFEHISEKLGNTNWARDNLVNFAEVPGFEKTQKDFIISNPRYRERMGGILSGPFIEGYIQNPWFNSSLAEKIGIQVKEREMGFDDFLGYAKALHDYNIRNNSAIPFIKLCTWNRLELFFETFFKSLFEDFSSAAEPVFNQQKKDALLKTLRAFEALAQYQPIFNEDWEQLPMRDYIKQFLLEDDGLFITGGTYMHGHFSSLDAEQSAKLIPVETPILGKKNGIMADFTPTFAVMKKSPHRDIAVDFLLFLSKPEYAEQWVSTTKSPTGLKGHLADFAMEKTDIYEKFAMDMQEKYGSVPMASLRSPTYVFGVDSPVTINELRLFLARILEGRLKAEDCYNELLSRLE